MDSLSKAFCSGVLDEVRSLSMLVDRPIVSVSPSTRKKGTMWEHPYPMLLAIFPSSVCMPVATTTPVALPRATIHPKNTMFLRSPRT